MFFDAFTAMYISFVVDAFEMRFCTAISVSIFNGFLLCVGRIPFLITTISGYTPTVYAHETFINALENIEPCTCTRKEKFKATVSSKNTPNFENCSFV